MQLLVSLFTTIKLKVYMNARINAEMTPNRD
jgi:hypothetical protein